MLPLHVLNARRPLSVGSAEYPLTSKVKLEAGSDASIFNSSTSVLLPTPRGGEGRSNYKLIKHHVLIVTSL